MRDIPERDARAIHAKAFELGDQRRRCPGLAFNIQMAASAVFVDANRQRSEIELLLERSIALQRAGQIPASELVPTHDVRQASVGLTKRKKALQRGLVVVGQR